MRISDWSSDVCSSDLVPVEEFGAECRAYAQHWVDTQREQLKRLGIGGDWDNPYLTMDYEAEATIVRELLKFAANDMLYRGAKQIGRAPVWTPVTNAHLGCRLLLAQQTPTLRDREIKPE